MSAVTSTALIPLWEADEHVTNERRKALVNTAQLPAVLVAIVLQYLRKNFVEAPGGTIASNAFQADPLVESYKARLQDRNIGKSARAYQNTLATLEVSKKDFTLKFWDMTTMSVIERSDWNGGDEIGYFELVDESTALLVDTNYMKVVTLEKTSDDVTKILEMNTGIESVHLNKTKDRLYIALYARKVIRSYPFPVQSDKNYKTFCSPTELIGQECVCIATDENFIATLYNNRSNIRGKNKSNACSVVSIYEIDADQAILPLSSFRIDGTFIECALKQKQLSLRSTDNIAVVFNFDKNQDSL